MVLNEKMRFPKDFDKDAKSLVKHLCEHDQSKRYGNLVDGVKDIKNHRFFKKFDFNDLL
jgi:protein kinase A